MDLKEAKERVADNRKDDVVKYKEALAVIEAEAETEAEVKE